MSDVGEEIDDEDGKAVEEESRRVHTYPLIRVSEGIQERVNE